MMKALDSMRSIEKAMATQRHLDPINKMAGIIDRMNAQSVFSSMKINDSIKHMMKSMDYGSSIQKAISSLNYSDSIQRATKALGHSSAIIKSLESMKLDDSVQRMMKSMDYAQSFSSAISSLNVNQNIKKMMESGNYLKNLNSISQSFDISSHMQSIGSYLSKPTILEQIIASNHSWQGLDFQKINISEDDFTQSIEPICNAKDDKNFVSCFLNAHPTIQAIIVFIFLQVFIPQLNNITSNILTPYVQETVLKSDITKKEIVKKIKNIHTSSLGVDVSKHRFITGANVRLRSRPSTNSRIIDELDIGQIVEVLNKKKNWIQVKVRYDEEDLTGWVFTRYTSRFKK